MQLVNYPDDALKSNNSPAASKITLRQWLPGILPLVAIALACAFGTADKAGEDINWLSRLANTGDSGAQLQVGLAYRDGRYGLTPDARKGLYWLKRAAQNGNAYAEDTLGSMYAQGNGTASDPAQAMQWWKKSMHDGEPQARLHLSEALIKTGKVQQAEALLQPHHPHLALQYN